jgi:hypothetical protein
MADEPTDAPGDARRRPSTAQLQLIGFIVILAVADIAYRLVYAHGAQRTAALYVGIPAILAIGLALLPTTGSVTVMLLKGTMLALLIAAVVLPEGLICLVFAAPLVLWVALLVGLPIDIARTRRRQRQGPTLMAVSIPLLLLSLEGVVGSPFATHDRASASITVAATADQVAEALARPPTFATALPPFLSLGFNRPVGATGAGIAVGDDRTIDFAGGTHDDHPLRLFGLTGERSVDHHAAMHLTVTESRPGRVVFAVDHDLTMLARWVDLDRAVVTWEALDARTTRVSWSLEYDRLLFPTAYFAPLQRYGMDQAAGYLLDAVIGAPAR